MNTRPAGLYDKATPVTIRDPAGVDARRDDAAARAERAQGMIDYSPVLSERELTHARLAIELRREALNRGRVPVALGVRA